MTLAKDNSELTPSLSVGLGYSDNIDQKHKNVETSFIAEVSPAIKYTKQGSRVKSSVDYRLSSYAYSNSSANQNDNINHLLQAQVQSELKKHTLFLDLDASITQELLNKRQNNLDSGTGINNLTETYTYGINPYWKQKWGSYAKSTVSYDYNEVRYNDSNNNSVNTQALSNNSVQHKAHVAIDDGRFFDKLYWRINLNYNEINYDDKKTPVLPEFESINADNTRSKTALLELGHEVSSQFLLTAKFGYEDYDQSNVQGSSNNGGNFSGYGFIWNPSPKTHLDVTIGNRFYGDTYNLTFKHQADVIGFNFKYNESITNSRDQLRESNNSLEGELAEEPTALDSLNLTSTGLYLSKKYTADVTYQLKKYSYRLNAYHDERFYDEGLEFLNEKTYGLGFDMTYQAKKSTINWGVYYENRDSAQFTQEGRDIGANISWGLNLGKRMNSVTSLNWNNQQYENDDNSSDDWLLSWQLNRQLSRTLSGNIRLSHHERISDIKIQEYDENIIFVNLNKTFR